MTSLLSRRGLRLRPAAIEDLDALYTLWTAPEVRWLLFDDRCISRDEAQAFVDASGVSFAQHGYGLWLVFEPDHEPIAGFTGLQAQPQGAPSLLFGTHPVFWGRGYATEAAAAVLHHVFSVLGLERVVADVDEPNAASICILEHLGMSRVRRTLVNGRPLLYYEIEPRCGTQRH